MRRARLLMMVLVGTVLPAPVRSEPTYAVATTWRLARTTAKSTALVEDAPGHEVGLLNIVLERSEALVIAGQQMTGARCSEVVDLLGVSGFTSAYCTLRFGNGDAVFHHYRGEYHGVASGTGGQQVSGQGTWQCVGGTGAFRGMTGEGRWESSGEVTADGLRQNWSRTERGNYRQPVTPPAK
ncbi:MAG: hypothetical protein QOD06_562 [Candidatus Binatota bacterium]|jgi:hypothetical protein|nr:hypothetical protein [Candidatus Binatota bacterium]